MAAAPGLDDGEHPALRTDPVALVEDAEGRPRVGPKRLEDERVGTIAGRGVHHEADKIDVLDGAPRGVEHEVAQLAVGRVEPGRVDEYDLAAPDVLDPGDAVPGRLRPR